MYLIDYLKLFVEYSQNAHQTEIINVFRYSFRACYANEGYFLTLHFLF